MDVDTTGREDVKLKIKDESSNAGDIWRDSSYDFQRDEKNMMKGNGTRRRRKQRGENGVRLSPGSSSSSGGSDNESNDQSRKSFDFSHSHTKEAAMEDPPTELIGQFLHKQKASGEFALDIDLAMPELQQETRTTLPTVSESPSPAANRVSFDNKVFSQPDSVRRRQFKDSPPQFSAKAESGSDNDEVVRCTSNRSIDRKSELLKTKTRSRFSDPPTPERGEPRSAKAPAGRSGKLMKSGFVGKNSAEEEEDDSLFDEDLPEEFKKDKLSFWLVLQWLSLVLIISAFICSLTIPYLRHKNLWNLMLWKWEVLVLVLICGRLVSGWIIRIIVFFIERNFLLRKRVLYFVYGVRKAVQNCLWLGLLLIAWHFLFDKKVQRETRSEFLQYVTKVLVCLVVGVMVWLVKTLLVKVLASSFHVSTFFDRIQDSLFIQYVIETLSGPPLVEIQKAEEEEKKLVDEVDNLQKAGAKVPSAIKASVFSSPRSGRTVGSGRTITPRGRGPGLSRVSSRKEEGEEGITIDHLHKMNHKNVSAWNMKRLMNIIRHGALSTLDEQIKDSSYGDETATQIKSEYEAKLAARRIFQNVSQPGSRYIYMEDIERFMQQDEAEKTMSQIEGATETKKVSKKAVKNWVVNAFRERRALALTLDDTKTAVNRLHRMVNILVGILIVVIWLLILGIATTKFLLFVSSQVVLVAFVFGNTCKTVFEALIFLFVMHPFDVGDRCEIDGVQMVVEEMNILTTVFLRYDNQKIIIPNSVLATKGIGNYYRSPDMGDAVEFCIHVATPAEKIALIKQRILSHAENKKEHWYPQPMIVFKELERLNMVRIAVWLQHRMNHQDMGERWTRRGLLLEEFVKIFKELDIQYRLYPLDINVRSLPTPSSDRLPSGWTGKES